MYCSWIIIGVGTPKKLSSNFYKATFIFPYAQMWHIVSLFFQLKLYEMTKRNVYPQHTYHNLSAYHPQLLWANNHFCEWSQKWLNQNVCYWSLIDSYISWLLKQLAILRQFFTVYPYRKKGCASLFIGKKVSQEEPF